MIKCKVNDVNVNFEVDTGSFLSTINKNDISLMPGVEINKTFIKAKGYGNNKISFLGETRLSLVFNDIKVIHKFLVVENSSVSLLGRDLCNKLNIRICLPPNRLGNDHIHAVDNDILLKYDKYLSPNFRSNVKQTVSLNVDPDQRPIFCKARSVPVRYRELVSQELNRLEQHGIVSKVYTSRWACPSVNVLRPDGRIRICGDYSLTINRCMEVVQYPLPSVEDVLAKVGSAKIFSKIDLECAYLQIPLDDLSKTYTTINTSEGLYQFNYLPFGISSSPGIFQSFMCKLLSHVKNVIVYQDDILVMTETRSDHDEVLDKVLAALLEAGIKVKFSKCSFYSKSVQYLGHVFNQSGVHPTAEKARAILEAPTPKNLKEVRSFLGLCNFYNRFIPNFSTVFAPLYKLTRKNASFEWSIDQNKCFNLVKDMFRSDKVLKLFNSKLESAIETDASSCGIGAVLMQKHPDGWFPVQFASRT